MFLQLGARRTAPKRSRAISLGPNACGKKMGIISCELIYGPGVHTIALRVGCESADLPRHFVLSLQERFTPEMMEGRRKASALFAAIVEPKVPLHPESKKYHPPLFRCVSWSNRLHFPVPIPS